MRDDLAEFYLLDADVVGTDADQGVIHFLPESGVILIIDVTLFVKAFEGIFLALEEDGGGAFGVDGLDDRWIGML